MTSTELLTRIARMRQQLADVERELREIGGTKVHARLLAELRETQ